MTGTDATATTVNVPSGAKDGRESFRGGGTYPSRKHRTLTWVFHAGPDGFYRRPTDMVFERLFYFKFRSALSGHARKIAGSAPVNRGGRDPPCTGRF